MEEEQYRILIVDDTPNNLKVLVHLFLEDGRYKVNVAQNGQEALDSVEKAQPDLILLDVMMPVMDGHEACRHLKENSETSHIPIIFLTAKTEVEDVTEGFNLGAADYVAKPFNTLELMARVETHLELKRSREDMQTRLEALVAERTRELETETAERLKVMEELQHAKKMEAVGQLAGGIAHDFNNQLAGIMGASELLMYDADEEQKDYLSIILRAAQSSSDLIKQLLSFSRRGKEVDTPINVSDVINAVTTLLERSVDKKVKVSKDVSSEPLVINGDPSQIENALLNLGINASHAMEENGGELHYHVDLVSLDESLDHSHVRVVVSDNGCGISEEVQEKMFEPFFTTKAKGKGTGMGLAAVYGAVQNHGGDLSVESELGKGTTFTLLFPFAAEAIDTIPHNDEILFGKEEHILLIDDEDVALKTCEGMLRRLNYKVTSFAHPREAIAFYEGHSSSVDLILTDFRMPDLSGIECLEELRKIEPEASAMILSGMSDGVTIGDGVIDFMKKPVSFSKLSQHLSDYFATQV